MSAQDPISKVQWGELYKLGFDNLSEVTAWQGEKENGEMETDILITDGRVSIIWGDQDVVRSITNRPNAFEAEYRTFAHTHTQDTDQNFPPSLKRVQRLHWCTARRDAETVGRQTDTWIEDDPISPILLRHNQGCKLRNRLQCADADKRHRGKHYKLKDHVVKDIEGSIAQGTAWQSTSNTPTLTDSADMNGRNTCDEHTEVQKGTDDEEGTITDGEPSNGVESQGQSEARTEDNALEVPLASQEEPRRIQTRALARALAAPSNRVTTRSSTQC